MKVEVLFLDKHTNRGKPLEGKGADVFFFLQASLKPAYTIAALLSLLVQLLTFKHVLQWKNDCFMWFRVGWRSW